MLLRDLTLNRFTGRTSSFMSISQECIQNKCNVEAKDPGESTEYSTLRRPGTVTRGGGRRQWVPSEHRRNGRLSKFCVVHVVSSSIVAPDCNLRFRCVLGVVVTEGAVPHTHPSSENTYLACALPFKLRPPAGYVEAFHTCTQAPRRELVQAMLPQL